MTLRLTALFVLAFSFTAVLTSSSKVANITSEVTQDKQRVGNQKSSEQIQAAQKTHQHDFDYLLGDWEFTGENREQGKFRGYWSAARMPETGQIMDEFRVVGSSGETYFVLTTWRAYNAILDQWELVTVDNRGTGLQNLGTAHLEGSEMRIEQRFGFGTPTSWISRIRYYNIQPKSFSWISDRSWDGGRTWIKDFQQIQARRLGPPRSLESLTPPKK